VLTVPIIYNYYAILADVKSNSFDLLRKNATTSGLAIEQIAANFHEDLTYLISTTPLPSLLEKDEIENNLLISIKRFYSKHKNLIRYIKVYNDQSYRILRQHNHNYFEISPVLKNALETEAFLLKKNVGETKFDTFYERKIFHNNELFARISIAVNIPLLARNELKKYYTMGNSWYWLIDEKGQIVTALFSEESVDSKSLKASGIDTISESISENFEGTIEHTLSHGKHFDLLTAYYPVNIFGKRFAVLFSADKDYVFRAVTHHTIIITVCFILIIVLVVISFLFIIKQYKMTEDLLKSAKDELEGKVKERTAELQESEEKYRLLFEKSEDPMLLIENNQIVMANKAAARSLGYDSTVELLQTHPEVHSPEKQPDGRDSSNKADEMMAIAFKEGYHRFEWEHKTRKNTPFPVEVSLTRVPYHKHDALFCVWRDITDRKQAEEAKAKLELQSQQFQKMEAMGLMAGGVAHDLNNILAGIVSYPDLILMKLAEDSPLQKPIKAIKDSGERAAAIVDDLLTISRNAASAREARDLNILIDEYLNSPEFEKLKADHPEISYHRNLEATQSNIFCSPVHIKKCLMNLVTNATEAINDSGTVTVTCHNRYVEKAEKSAMEAGEYLVLCVEDTGSGISKEDIKHIFEPFYTKKLMGRSGTGLGLTVVWNTVNDHEGNIFVESSDKGTVFQLYFPVHTKDILIKIPADLEKSFTGNGEIILVIDDEPYLRNIASQALEALGYKVYTVSSGESAVEFVKETKVDLLVIDMLMEPGMSGRQTYEEIIKIHPGQKAIIASGFSESEDVKATLFQGAGGFIKKPYSIQQLGRAVKEVLSN
jgi:PAS domain S-box-containing protein